MNPNQIHITQGRTNGNSKRGKYERIIGFGREVAKHLTGSEEATLHDVYCVVAQHPGGRTRLYPFERTRRDRPLSEDPKVAALSVVAQDDGFEVMAVHKLTPRPFNYRGKPHFGGEGTATFQLTIPFEKTLYWNKGVEEDDKKRVDLDVWLRGQYVEFDYRQVGRDFPHDGQPVYFDPFDLGEPQDVLNKIGWELDTDLDAVGKLVRLRKI